MTLCDLHTHTNFCDGKNSAEEMVNAAIEKGMECIGFSEHSHTPFDESYCLKGDRTAEYIAEINRLKEKYAGKIRILCGIELDYYSDTDPKPFDYIIASVHYVKFGSEYVTIDESADILKSAADRYCRGDMYALAEKYYETVGKIKKADIIGHIDLISKFNEKEHLFDESAPRYVAAYKAAVRKLVKTGALFEINTGAISRGYKKNAYPNRNIALFIAKKGGKFILSGDAHSCDSLCFDFDRAESFMNSLTTL